MNIEKVIKERFKVFEKLTTIGYNTDSKIINLNNGDSKIIPNLIIDNKEVVANHSAFIGNFKEDEVNYLKSRGLNQETINDLLLKATLLNGMKLEYDKDKFIYFIRNYKKS